MANRQIREHPDLFRLLRARPLGQRAAAGEIIQPRAGRLPRDRAQHGRAELIRAGGGDDHASARVAGFPLIGAQNGAGHGRVRIHQVMIFFPCATNLRADARLVNAARKVALLQRRLHRLVDGIALLARQIAHEPRDARAVAAAQIKQQPLQIRGDEDIHRRRDGLVEWAVFHIVYAGVDKVGQHVVFVAGADQPAYRQTGLARVIRRQNVAEVARRHAEIHLVARLDRARFQQIGVGGKIIHHLRHEAAEIDGVRGGKHAPLRGHRFGKDVIREDALHAGLRIVKVAVHGNHMGVRAAGRDHLQALRLTHALARVKHAATRPRHVEEALQRGLAGVAAGRHEDEDFAGFAVLLRAERQQMRQKLERHILEGERRPVPKLQRVRPIADGAHRRDVRVVKARAVSPGNGVFQLVRREIGQEFLQNRQRPRLIIKRAERSDFFHRKMRKILGHIQPAVRRKAAQDGHGFGDSGRAAGRKHRHDDHSLKTKKPLPDKRQEAASEKRESDLVLADALRHILRVLAEADDQIALGVGHQTLKLRKEIHQLGRLGLHQLEERIDIDHADIVVARENAGQEAVERFLALDGVLARVDEADLRLEAKRIALVIVDEQNVALRFLHGSVRHIQNALGLAGTLLAKDNLDHGQSLPFLFSDYPHYSLKHPFCIAPKFLFSPKKARGQRINLSFLLVYLAFFRQACYKYFIQLCQKEEAG